MEVRQSQNGSLPSGPTQQNGPDQAGQQGGIYIARELNEIVDDNSSDVLERNSTSKVHRKCIGKDCDVVSIKGSQTSDAMGREIQHSKSTLFTLTLTAPTTIQVPAQTGQESSGIVIITQESSSQPQITKTTRHHTQTAHPTLTLTDPTTLFASSTRTIVAITVPSSSSNHTSKSRATHITSQQTTTLITTAFLYSQKISSIHPIQYTRVPPLHLKSHDAWATASSTSVKTTSGGGAAFTAPVTSWSTFSTLPILLARRVERTKSYSSFPTTISSSNGVNFDAPVNSWSTFSTLPTLLPKSVIPSSPMPNHSPNQLASSCTIILIHPTPLTLGTVFTSYKSTLLATRYNDCGGCALVTSNPRSLERAWDKTKIVHEVETITTEVCAPSYVSRSQAGSVSGVEDVHHTQGLPFHFTPIPTTLLTRARGMVANTQVI